MGEFQVGGESNPMSHLPTQLTDLVEESLNCREQGQGPETDVQAAWRTSLALDLDQRSVLEAEVLLWRIYSKPSVSQPSSF